MKLLGIAGSLREGSYNRSLLRAAREVLPEGVELVECEIGGQVMWGVGLDPSTVTAAFKAIVSAVNRALR